MNWLTNFIRPKIRSIVEQQKDVPENLWQKCPSCEGMRFFLYPDNMAQCVDCEIDYEIRLFGTIYLVPEDLK